MARNALNRNPLMMDALIPELHEPHAVFETSTPMIGARSQVISIMADGAWRTLPQIAAELKRRFNTRAMETAISARVRDMRRKGWIIECQRKRPGSNLYQYRAIAAATSSEEVAA